MSRNKAGWRKVRLASWSIWSVYVRWTHSDMYGFFVIIAICILYCIIYNLKAGRDINSLQFSFCVLNVSYKRKNRGWPGRNPGFRAGWAERWSSAFSVVFGAYPSSLSFSFLISSKWTYNDYPMCLWWGLNEITYVEDLAHSLKHRSMKVHWTK